MTVSNKTAKVTIIRGAQGQKTYEESFDVPFEEGASILDALTWIRSHRDSSIAFRYSCVNANACKECMVLVNNKVDYACTARLEETGVTVGPLKNKRLIRDLVTDIVPPKERF
jgi:succinate dehydrogenase/fumarate reductase-like Fe-S protein